MPDATKHVTILDSDVTHFVYMRRKLAFWT